MRVIEYRINGDSAEWAGSYGSDGIYCELRFEGEPDGKLFFGSTCFTTSKGICKIAKSLPDGEYEPILKTSTGATVHLEKLCIYNNRILLLPTEDRVIRGLLKRIRDAEMRLILAEKRIDELTVLCRGNELFK